MMLFELELYWMWSSVLSFFELPKAPGGRISSRLVKTPRGLWEIARSGLRMYRYSRDEINNRGVS